MLSGAQRDRLCEKTIQRRLQAIMTAPYFFVSSSLSSTQPRYSFINYALGALYPEIDYGYGPYIVCYKQHVLTLPHSACFLLNATGTTCYPNYMLSTL